MELITPPPGQIFKTAASFNRTRATNHWLWYEICPVIYPTKGIKHINKQNGCAVMPSLKYQSLGQQKRHIKIFIITVLSPVIMVS